MSHKNVPHFCISYLRFKLRYFESVCFMLLENMFFMWVQRKIGSHWWGCIFKGWNCKYSKYKILVYQCTRRKCLWKKNIRKDKLSVWAKLCGNGGFCLFTAMLQEVGSLFKKIIIIHVILIIPCYNPLSNTVCFTSYCELKNQSLFTNLLTHTKQIFLWH